MLKKALLNIYFWPVFACFTLVGLGLVPFIILFNKVFHGRRAATSVRLAIRLYGWVLIRVVPFMAPVTVSGRTDPPPRPAIFVANHNSAIDPYLFGAIPGDHCFVTSWPFKIPVYGPLMRLAGYIDTTQGWDSMRTTCLERLGQQVSVIIWPEGHRSRNGKMGRFRKGAFQLAVESGYPIQPVCIIGSGDVMLPGERLLTPARVKLVLLDPIYPAGQGDFQERICILRRQCSDAIGNCLLEHRHVPRQRSSRPEAEPSLIAPEEACNGPSHDIY